MGHNPEEQYEGYSYLRSLRIYQNIPGTAEPTMPIYEDDEWDRMVDRANQWHLYELRNLHDKFDWTKATRPMAPIIAYLFWKSDIRGKHITFTYDEIEQGSDKSVVDGKPRKVNRWQIKKALELLVLMGCKRWVEFNERGMNKFSHLILPDEWDTSDLPSVRLHPRSVHIEYSPEYTNPSRECSDFSPPSLGVYDSVVFEDDVPEELENWTEYSFDELFARLGGTRYYDHKDYRRLMTIHLSKYLAQQGIERGERGTDRWFHRPRVDKATGKGYISSHEMKEFVVRVTPTELEELTPAIVETIEYAIRRRAELNEQQVALLRRWTAQLMREK